MTHTINIIRSLLSDGSAVYAVQLDNLEPIDAVTEFDAELFADGLNDLITRHTNDDTKQIVTGAW